MILIARAGRGRPDLKGQKTILQLSEQFGKGPVEKARSKIFKWPGNGCQLSAQF